MWALDPADSASALSITPVDPKFSGSEVAQGGGSVVEEASVERVRRAEDETEIKALKVSVDAAEKV